MKVFGNDDNNDKTGLLAGLLVGVVVGVALGMLLAPKRGGETREMLRQGIASGTERVRRLRRGEEDGE
jgi:gas vesicle protein